VNSLKYSVSLVVKHLKGRNALINYLEEDVNVDSDCEDDPMGAGEGTSKTKEEAEEETRAVLVTGSLAAYVCYPTSYSRREK
jgi:hypothetical protein